MIVTNYHVVDAKDIDTLEIKVVHLLRQGWQPYGEYRVLTFPVGEDGYLTGFSYQQAMVRYDDINHCIHEFTIRPFSSLNPLPQYAFEIKCRICGITPKLTYIGARKEK